jgi:hydroxyethylthiazole kinase
MCRCLDPGESTLPALEAASVRGVILGTVRGMRDRSPLVHNVTNYVVMEVTANVLLAAGASALMAHEPEEMDDLLSIASALVLNIGTLDKTWIASMERAGEAANKRGKPVVLDPVGAGASRLRTRTSLYLLESVRPKVLRGNASEIMALAPEAVGAAFSSRGVDSTNASLEAAPAAMFLAEKYGCAVSVSGAEDWITDGCTTLLVKGGTPLMTRVTGMGCSSTALTAACVAVADSPLMGAAAAMALMAAAGNRAAATAGGPGSFLPAFLDALSCLEPAEAAECVYLTDKWRL